jgi:hypothetical protein
MPIFKKTSSFVSCEYQTNLVLYAKIFEKDACGVDAHLATTIVNPGTREKCLVSFMP